MKDGQPEPVHQLLLGLRPGEGVAFHKHSMTSDSEASSWQKKLEKHARLLSWETETALPAKALSYYQFGSHVAVLRRWAAGGSLGRSDAHALIGPVDVLTVPVALGLDSGLDWQRAADAAQSALAGRDVVSFAQANVAELRDRAAGEPEILRRALGKLIDAQAKPLTILGCPDNHRVALIWALVYIGNEYLTKSGHILRRWTFSTYEIEDDDSIPNLPEILFMPGKPVGRGVASREIVDVRRDEPVSREADTWSESLVQRFISGASLVPELDRLAVIPVAEDAPISTGQPERREQERPPSQSVRDRRKNQAGTGAYPEDWQQGAEDSPESRVPNARKIGSQQLEKDINDLLRAENINLIDSRLSALGRTPEKRAEIRGLLSIDNYLKIIVIILEWKPVIDDRLALFQRLRVATFGSGGRDLSDPDAAAFAVRLVAHRDAPDLFVHDLVKEIDANGQSNLVNPALASRWRAQRGPASDLTGASPGEYRMLGTVKAGPLGAVMSVLAWPRWPLAAAGITLLALILFIVTYSIDAGTSGAEPSGAESQASHTTASPPPVVRQEKETTKPAEVSGSVAAHDLVIRGPWRATEDKPVFLLLRTVGKEQAYPQGPCVVNKQAHSWVCEKLPLTWPAPTQPGFEVLVVTINAENEQRYQNAVNTKEPLSDQPAEKDVIFKTSGLS